MAKEKRLKFPDKKLNAIKEYQELFASGNGVYLIKFSGTNVEQITNFRKNLRSSDSQLKVIKNRLAKIAVSDIQLDLLKDHLTTDNAVVISKSDAAATAKLVVDEMKDTESIKLVGGILYDNKDKFLSEAEVVALSRLPSREVLLAQLLGALNGPIVKLVRTLNEPIASLARVLQAASQKS